MSRHHRLSVLTDFTQASKICHKINSDELVKKTYVDGKEYIPTRYFNPGIVTFKGIHIMVYRTENVDLFAKPVLHAVQFDSDTLQPIGKSFTLNTIVDEKGWGLHYKTKYGTENEKQVRGEDPRLIVYNDELLMFFTDGFNQYVSSLEIKIENNELKYAGVKNISKLIIPYINFKWSDGRVKNLTPIVKDGKLLIVFLFEPLIIFELEKNGSKYQLITEPFIYHKDVCIKYPYGNLRGGVPFLKYYDNYLTFFHSVYIDRNETRVYYMGAIEYDSDWKITRISRYPILSPSATSVRKVVFPCGAIHRGDYILVSFGYDDHDSYIAKVPCKAIEENLAVYKPCFLS